MDKYYVLRDNTIVGIYSEKEEALERIQQLKQRETHFLVRSEFSILKSAEQEFIK